MNTHSASSSSFVKGTFWERALAILLDDLILIIPNLLVQLAMGRIFPEFKSISYAAQWILMLSYNIFLISTQGATIGKKIMKLKVVTDSYQTVPMGTVILRETLAKWIGGILLNLGYLWILIDKRRQGWHDKISKTFVVKVDPKGNPIPGVDTQVPKSALVSFIGLFLLWGLPLLIMPGFIFSYLFLIQPNEVKGDAMAPNFKNGEFFITDKIYYKFHQPQRGDVVIFTSPKSTDIEYIKRIIAVPGEQITIYGGKVYINKVELKEPYLPENTLTSIYPGGFAKEDKPMTVPMGYYFVLGDNREKSSDSREFGVVPKENILGRYWFKYFSK